MDQRVVTYDEQNRGQRASLFDPAEDRDPDVKFSAEKRGNTHAFEGSLDKSAEPTGEFSLVENVVDPVVVDAVECLRCIEKEENTIVVQFHPVVEEFIHTCD